jgi:hypothetical protein
MSAKRREVSKDFLIGEAVLKGFKVTEGKTGWLVHVPARKRHAANVQGDFTSKERAWMAAASLAMEFE